MGGYQQIETIKNNKMEMLVMKITKYLRGKYLCGRIIKMNKTEKKISELENRSIDIIQTETLTNTTLMKKRKKHSPTDCRRVSEGLHMCN